jgi:hypothetical protein
MGYLIPIIIVDIVYVMVIVMVVDHMDILVVYWHCVVDMFENCVGVMMMLK